MVQRIFHRWTQMDTDQTYNRSICVYLCLSVFICGKDLSRFSNRYSRIEAPAFSRR
jgi:hypothetical protein